MSQVEVPVIDISGQGASDVERIARQIDRAFREIGFMTIVGHGVPRKAIADVDEVVKQFFERPVAEKLLARSSVERGNRGYIAEGIEAADAKPDLKESYAIGRLTPLPDNSKTKDAGRKFEPNIWPANPPAFKAAFEAYYREMEALTFRLLHLFEVALHLPAGYFTPLFSEHASILRVHHYPKQIVPPQPGQIRIGAHADYGAFTILKVKRAPGARGFQVRSKQGTWIDVEPHDDSFLINIGDMMMTWTNDEWQSNVHRVINPKEESENVGRYSVPFFVQPNYDALIECLPSCLATGASPRHPPITAGDYRAQKIAGLYART
jgi:isopenicillin N synthase-like dioxygenase